MATILLALEHNEPLDKVIYCKLMFNKEYSCEYKDHEEFIKRATKFLEEKGIEVVTLIANKTYDDYFHRIKKQGERKGTMYGPLISGMCLMSGEAKNKTIKKYLETIKEEYVQYVGIAHDEVKRLARLTENKISLLDKYKVDEKDTYEICKKYNMLSPMYEKGFTRLGCWFCPNSVMKHLPYLRRNMQKELDIFCEWLQEKNIGVNKICYDKTIEQFLYLAKNKTMLETIEEINGTM